MNTIRLRSLLALLSLITLLACASRGPTYETAPKPPVNAGMATVFLIRSTSDFHAIGSTNVYVGDVRHARLGDQTYTWIQLPAGKHLLGASWAVGDAPPELRKEFNLAAGSTTYLILNSRLAGRDYSREFAPLNAGAAGSMLRGYTYVAATAGK